LVLFTTVKLLPLMAARHRRGCIAIPAPTKSGIGVNAAQDLIERRFSLDDREQPAVEDRRHAAVDRGAPDRRVVGARENQTVGRPDRLSPGRFC